MKVRDAATILDDAPAYSPPGDWRQRAACRGLDPNLFVTERGEPTAEAKAVCRSCPSLHECAVAGICDSQLRGVWGGLSERERRQARSAMGRMHVCVECAEPFHSYPGAGAAPTYCGDGCRRAARLRSKAEHHARVMAAAS